jgi:hypothetical protein
MLHFIDLIHKLWIYLIDVFNCYAVEWVRTEMDRWQERCGKIVDIRGGFDVLFPMQWIGKSTYAPIKAALLQNLLGQDWYEQLHGVMTDGKTDETRFQLAPDEYKQWRNSTAVRMQLSKNLDRILREPALMRSLSAIGFMQLLQTAYDFDIDNYFDHLWKLTKLLPWSDDELALFHQVY